MNFTTCFSLQTLSNQYVKNTNQGKIFSLFIGFKKNHLIQSGMQAECKIAAKQY